ATLAAAPRQSVALLGAKVQPTVAVDAAHIHKLIADLDSDQFAVREQADIALAELGIQAQPALRKVLDGQPSLEARCRVERVLEQFTSGRFPSAEVVRKLRAVQVLERLGTPEARQVLQTLANGVPGDWLTRQAEAALKRLDGPTPQPTGAGAPLSGSNF